MAIVNNAPAKKAPAKNRVAQAEMDIGNYFCRIAQVIDLGLHHKDVWDDAQKKFVKDLDKQGYVYGNWICIYQNFYLSLHKQLKQ